jgi:excinuclease ABC subunit B
LIVELKKQVESKNRTFITVLTIALAENLTEYLIKHKFKVAYLHNKLKTLERAKIVNDLRRGKYDILVGINLLREGLDVPEVSLVVIFDADKTGLFRNETSLIQTFGRAARNKNGRVILYAKQMTESIKTAIDETERRRKLQTTYNTKHKIIPQTIIKPIFDDISTYGKDSTFEQILNSNKKADLAKKTQALKNLHKEMLKAARNKEYERAAYIRDIILSVNENKID